MTDRQTLESSLRSVQQAHGVLAAFHREIVAFFRVVEDDLEEDGQGCKLTPFGEKNDFVWTYTTSGNRVEEWVPSYLGRLYYDAELGVGEGEPETLDSRAAAFVAMYVPGPEGRPECWFGFGRPGEGTRSTNGWNFARNGLWNHRFERGPENAWASGTFDRNTGFLGVDGRWHLRRTPLVDLTSPGAVRELVSMPLLHEWARVMRA